MQDVNTPKIFEFLISVGCIEKPDILKTSDGFYMVNKSIAEILFKKDILDFPDSSGDKLRCDNFFDDWFLYAVSIALRRKGYGVKALITELIGPAVFAVFYAVMSVLSLF